MIRYIIIYFESKSRPSRNQITATKTEHAIALQNKPMVQKQAATYFYCIIKQKIHEPKPRPPLSAPKTGTKISFFVDESIGAECQMYFVQEKKITGPGFHFFRRVKHSLPSHGPETSQNKFPRTQAPTTPVDLKT